MKTAISWFVLAFIWLWFGAGALIWEMHITTDLIGTIGYAIGAIVPGLLFIFFGIRRLRKQKHGNTN